MRAREGCALLRTIYSKNLCTVNVRGAIVATSLWLRVEGH